MGLIARKEIDEGHRLEESRLNVRTLDVDMKALSTMV